MSHDRPSRLQRTAATLTPPRLALACALALLALAAASAPALALSQRGHEYASSFAHTGEGALSDPGALAVSQATGDLYVLDRGHNRIVQFAPDGQFISAWGFGVAKEGKAGTYEVCQSECKAGVPGPRKDQFSPQTLQVAVDNCTNAKGQTCTSSEDPSVGDVYIATPLELKEEELEQIDKFTPSGQPLEAIHLVKYLPQEKSKHTEAETVELSAEGAHGLTVAPDGTVWLYYEEKLFGLSDVKLAEATFKQKPLEFTPAGEPASGLAVDAQGDFYLAQTLPAGSATNVISKYRTIQNEAHEPELQEVSEQLDGQDTSGVATDATRGEVYLNNLTSVSSFQQAGTLIQSFGSEASEPNAAEHLKDASAIAVDAHTRDVFLADASADRIDLFTPERPAPPTIESLSAQEVSSETAQLDATIDPRGATEQTSWQFEYGTGPCPAACTTVPGGQLGGEAFADEGFGEQAVDVHLGAGTGFPLSPSTTYRYRVLAENPQHGRSAGPEGSFSTPPATGAFIADERAWEMVSPPDQHGADVDPLGTEFPGPTQAAADGTALAYTANGPFCAAEGNRSIEVTQILAARTPDGWSCQDLLTPNSAGTGLNISQPSEYRFFSADLSLSLLLPYQGGGTYAQPPLAPPASPAEEQRQSEQRLNGEPQDYQEKTIYLRDDQPLQPDTQESALYQAAQANGTAMGNPGYLALLTGADAPGASFGGHDLRFADATADLSHVAIESETPLQSSETQHGLYEWSTGARGEATLQPVNTLEAGTQPKTFLEDAYLGGLGAGGPTGARSLEHAISTDGSRLFWTSGPHLYMRDMTAGPQPQTLQLDVVQPEAPGAGPEHPEHAVFQTASADGSRVLFTDEAQLTPDSGAALGQPDLYACQITENQSTHTLQCDLTDLTPKSASGESADVQHGGETSAQDIGGVLGASEDASTVYFVANGVLSQAPGVQGTPATPGHCGSEGYPQATCNLYSERYDPETNAWEEPRFIAALSNEDQPDWAGQGQGHLTSRVSPDGAYLAFMSERPLTSFQGRPYDTDSSSPAADGAPAEEVYEYAAPTAAQAEKGEPGTLVCASCEPSGARPLGVLDPSREQTTASLLVDESGRWEGRWLAGNLPEWPGISTYGEQAVYQNRVLSDSGRLYFDSPEPLVPRDTNGREDVYEYEPTGVPQGPHACTSTSATFSERSKGCVGLISSGTSTSESAFLDASETGGEGEHSGHEGGGDVFFVTAEKLSPADIEGGFDVYDAHECTTPSPCLIPPEEKTPTVCQSTQACRTYTPPSASTPATPASAAPGAPGNLTPNHAVLPNKAAAKPKPLTNAQKLAKALKTCRTRYRHSPTRRAVCEKQARKRYAPAKKAKAPKATSKGRGHR